MQIKQFTYTKASKEQSQRTAMVIQAPSNMFLCQDLSELDEDQVVEYAREYGNLLDSFKAKVAHLNEQFDVNHRMRQFDPLKMTDCEDTWVGEQ